MKRLKRLSLYITTLLVICQVALCVAPAVSAKSSADNFYFKSFTADYYLTKDDNGLGHLLVVEELVAVFPESDQNHGIVRNIPIVNEKSDGLNNASMIVLPHQRLDKKDIKITHNGKSETADTIEDKGNYFAVYIRNPAEYVHGTQTYTLEYEFENVITAFDDKGHLVFNPAAENYQELYWNTNGTGWEQPFDTLTANVHISDPSLREAWRGESWCYVGTAGASGQNRCTTTKTSDGVTFKTKGLSSRENLTFDLKLKPRTFNIPALPYNYNVIIFASIFGLALLIAIIMIIKVWVRAGANRRAYKKSFKPAQYTPMKNLSVAEIATLSLKKAKNIPEQKIRVATLIEMAVNHNIALIQGDKKIFGQYEWSIKVDNLKDVPLESVAVLQILNQGQKVKAGQTFTVERQRYNSELKALSMAIDAGINENLINKQMLKPDEERKTKEGKILLWVLLPAFLIFIAFIVVGAAFFKAAGTVMLGAKIMTPIIPGILIIMIVGLLVFRRARQYLSYQDKGIEAAIYLDGLREYITLAEAERLKVLQSVKGADTTPQGIVKLYEKLLPYAIIFGLEKSWLAELNRYYEMADVKAGTWYVGTGPMHWSSFNSFSSGIGTSFSSGSGSGGSGGSGGGGGGGGGGGC